MNSKSKVVAEELERAHEGRLLNLLGSNQSLSKHNKQWKVQYIINMKAVRLVWLLFKLLRIYGIGTISKEASPSSVFYFLCVCYNDWGSDSGIDSF